MQLFIGIGGPEILLGLLLLGLVIILPLIAVIDVLRSKFRSDTDKIIWLLVILFLPFFGSILYFIIGRKQRIE
ncbi:hypothetical protein GCM10023189_52980 [Nibrella saemangeumensis]|uniref:Cardiolipin synthase N-terminal domain-containing protein n=1 Tax=Nibrella saemangeumensis TaxID=1084526 RepID=A0ABP8NM71_9BACT